jgi:hypothetical protein
VTPAYITAAVAATSSATMTVSAGPPTRSMMGVGT